jgi:hypothetical protein
MTKRQHQYTDRYVDVILKVHIFMEGINTSVIVMQ